MIKMSAPPIIPIAEVSLLLVNRSKFWKLLPTRNYHFLLEQCLRFRIPFCSLSLVLFLELHFLDYELKYVV